MLSTHFSNSWNKSKHKSSHSSHSNRSTQSPKGLTAKRDGLRSPHDQHNHANCSSTTYPTEMSRNSTPTTNCNKTALTNSNTAANTKSDSTANPITTAKEKEIPSQKDPQKEVQFTANRLIFGSKHRRRNRPFQKPPPSCLFDARLQK